MGDAVTRLANDPNIEKVITHVLSSSKVADAFDSARDSEASGKVLVSLWRGEEG